MTISGIPLSDATLENGCMYIVPRNLIPERIAKHFSKIEVVEVAELGPLLQAIRALPARAGSILGWDFGVIHWGSTCDNGKEPRISISVEFLREHKEPKRNECPLLETQVNIPASLNQRLAVIGRAILTYQRFEASMIRFAGLASRLIEETAKVSG